MKRIVLAVALFVPLVARGADQVRPQFVDQPALCTSARNVLRIGVPRSYDPRTIASDDRFASLTEVIHQIYARAVRNCATPPPQLELQITAGNDYQMVEWLGGGSIDAAILTDMGIAIVGDLDGDGIPLYEITTIDQPRYVVAPIARRRTANGWVDVADNDAFRKFLDEVWSDRKPTHRLALAHHLSATGFLEPLRQADAFLNEHQATNDQREAFWKRWFERAQFTIDCDSTQNCFDQLATERFNRIEPGTTAVLFPGEHALAAEGTPVPGEGYQERFVITQTAARRVFDAKTRIDDRDSEFATPRVERLDFFFHAADHYIPPQFQAMSRPDPVLGFRTYGFSVDEIFGLLRQEQAIRGTDDLALVLPGGGVKAAYQSRIVDSLYADDNGAGYLRNAALATAPSSALNVRSVIGTSGGALLGFFVSQLRAHPPKLAEMLWRPDNKHLLRTGDVFAWTDLMRYVAINVAFALFCLVLAAFSARALATNRTTSPAYPKPVKVVPMWRARLLLPLLIILLATPCVVRAIGGDDLKEHVPEFEGILFTLMTVLVMSSDQLLVRNPQAPRAERDHPRDYRVLFLLGGGLLLLTSGGALWGWIASIRHASVVGRLTAARADFLLEPVTFPVVFTLLFATIVIGGLVILERTNNIGSRRARLVEAFFALVLTLVVCALLPAFQVQRLIPGALLVVAVLLTGYYASQDRELRGLPFFATLSVTLLIAFFSWPESFQRGSGLFDAAIFTVPAADMNLGTFFAMIGLLLLVVAAVRWAYCSDLAFSIVKPGYLLLALAVGIVHVFITFGVIQTLGWLDVYVTPFELAGSFWIGLMTSAVAVALIVVALAAYGGRRWKSLRRATRHLVSMHPNGIYLQRRFARLIAIGGIALAWWNVILAPALYGNNHARRYLDQVVRHFRETAPQFEPATRFVAPTSVLDSNEARYFMFLPRNTECPPIPARLLSREWKVFRPGEAKGDGVAPMDDALVLRVIFASGSPFPVFPAHHVGDDWLIDGGYASNIPVDAARTLNAKQLLIIHSANPIEDLAPSKAKEFPGKLIANLARLPGFLFARSQEVDRISRRGVFVASLAPPPDERPWPTLTDFKSSVVQKMLDAGERHVKMRIGAIESWGEPSFQVTEQIEPR